MKVLVCGASGMIGKALVASLKDHQVSVLGRSFKRLKRSFGKSCECLTWQTLTDDFLASYDVIVNLSGANIAQSRWTSSRKQQIIDSRVKTTEQLVAACLRLGDNSPRLLNASAIGIYGIAGSLQQQQSTHFDESSVIPNPPSDFLCQVGVSWEHALQPAQQAGLSVVQCRFGVVLDPSGGMLKKLLPSFRLGLGSTLATGQQPLSWVSLSDVVRALHFIMAQPSLTGAINIVAPETVSQATFSRTLAQQLSRPCLLNLPEFAIKAMFGQMGVECLMSGQTVVSKVLPSHGFEYEHTTLKKALSSML